MLTARRTSSLQVFLSSDNQIAHHPECCLTAWALRRLFIIQVPDGRLTGCTHLLLFCCHQTLPVQLWVGSAASAARRPGTSNRRRPPAARSIRKSMPSRYAAALPKSSFGIILGIFQPPRQQARHALWNTRKLARQRQRHRKLV